MKVQAYAKINLGLRVLAKRPDGYHNIDTVFAEVDLADEITIKARKDGEIRVSGIDVPPEKNSIFQAVWLLQKFTDGNPGAEISVEKQIPIEAGLGGGSSDAAVTLKALNKLWKLKLSEKRLEHLAAKLGADAPFFIRGGVQRGRGIGDRLSDFALPKKFPREIVIVNPEIPVSTKWAYENLGARFPTFAFQASAGKQVLGSREKRLTKFKKLQTNEFSLDNDFESLIFHHLPYLKKIKSAIKRSGAEEASLSGSGSALFGLFRTRKAAKEASEKLAKYGKIFQARILA